MLQIDETQAFMAGGISPNPLRDAYTYNYNTEDWLELPNMTVAREEHACASYRDTNGTTHILVVGE